MKKVIEQGKGYLGVQYLTETISVYQRFGLNPKGVFILIDKPKAREVALAIDPELESEIAEKDKEIERLKEQIVNANEFILEVAKYEKETTSTRFRLWAKAYIKKYTNINIESLNK